jgi:hypothetical protein
MTCEACEDARARRHGGARIVAGCMGCIAREVARGPQFFAACKEGRITPDYKKLLKHYFGDEWQRGHQLVKEWAA